MKPLDPKDEQIARLQAERVELLNYILKLERELQTGELNGQRNDTSGNQRPQDPAS